MFEFLGGWKAKIENLINTDAAGKITDEDFIVKEIQSFMTSQKRKFMVDGDRYFNGDHDILLRQRTVIGVDGDLEVVKNLPNNRIVDNQYEKMVMQKSNYLVGQPFSVDCDNDEYSALLKREYFNRRFLRTLKVVSEESLNCGIGWMYIHYDEEGKLTFKHFSPWEIIPGWKDADHTELEYFIRVYDVKAYVGDQERIITKVEVYDELGVNYFEFENGHLKVERPHENYFTLNEQPYNWSKIPLVPFKYNHKEIPLIKRCKSLQDGINTMLSNFENGMEEDTRNTIMVLVNYDGENLGEFRKNLATFGAVKVRTVDGAGGDVRTLQVEVSSENYKAIVQIFKDALIENCKGFDAKDDRMKGNPNQMNILSMYSDIDLDANGMETEYQAAFEEILWFIDAHLFNVGVGDFEADEVNIVFNRDILISESDTISNIQASAGILSDETLIANHPWVDDVQLELDRIKKQKEEEMLSVADYQNAFNQGVVDEKQQVLEE